MTLSTRTKDFLESDAPATVLAEVRDPLRLNVEFFQCAHDVFPLLIALLPFGQIELGDQFAQPLQ